MLIIMFLKTSYFVLKMPKLLIFTENIVPVCHSQVISYILAQKYKWSQPSMHTAVSFTPFCISKQSCEMYI